MPHFGVEQPVQKFAIRHVSAADAGANSEVHERVQVSGCAPQASPSAEPLTSRSKAMGISKADFNMPNTLAFDQPGLGVGRIKPKVGEAGFGSMGPKEANPNAKSLPKSFSTCLKKAIVLSSVPTGGVVGKRSSR